MGDLIKKEKKSGIKEGMWGPLDTFYLSLLETKGWVGERWGEGEPAIVPSLLPVKKG